MVAHLGEMEYAPVLLLPPSMTVLYSEDVLRAALIERIHDKETPLCLQAAVVLPELWDSEDASNVQDDKLTTILDTLACDSVAYVSCAKTNPTLDSILARSRDMDTGMHRLVHSAILEKNYITSDGSTMGQLSPSHKENSSSVTARPMNL